MKKERPIGVFDSGLGGLTVMKALMRHLPYEDIVYLGDTARVPYGTKSRESIVRFSVENVSHLLRRRVKMVVVACNSSSSYALDTLCRTFTLPILGVIEAGVLKAARTTRTRVVGVIATPATIASRSYQRQLAAAVPRLRVVSQPCPLFVPLVEEGWFRAGVTEMIAEEYLRKIKSSKADTLILGCTHYPLLKPVLKKVLGPKVTLVDSALEVSRMVKIRLEREGGLRAGPRIPRYEFLVSDQPDHFQKLARRFLGYNIRTIKRLSPQPAERVEVNHV
jgi:glutamate racemase